jgi:hypothetical protein
MRYREQWDDSNCNSKPKTGKKKRRKRRRIQKFIGIGERTQAEPKSEACHKRKE